MEGSSEPTFLRLVSVFSVGDTIMGLGITEKVNTKTTGEKLNESMYHR